MFSGWGCKIAYRVMQDVNKGRQAKEEKKSKPSKKEHKGKKERKRSASPSSPLRQFPLLDTETLRFYRGKPCALLALSYETDPPHAIIRTAEGREVGVEMDQLSEAPQQRKKRKKQKKEKGEAGEAAVVTIDCSSASPSPERGAAGASGADPAEAAPAAEAAEEAAARREAASEASPAAASEEAAEGSASGPAAAAASGGGGAPSPAASAEAAEAADYAVAEGVAEAAEAAEPAEAAASAEAAEAAPPAAPRGSEAGGPALGRAAAAAETAEAATATPAGSTEAAEASPESAEAAEAAAEAVAAAEAARARAPSARSERQEVPAEAKPQQQRSRPPPQPPPDAGRRERGAAGRRATAAEGREAAAVGEGAEEAAVGPGVAGPGDGSRRLAESALYREDVLAHGHSEVWGSWFDAESQRWGYRCCRGLVRAQPCACERRHAAEPSTIGSSDGGPSAPGAETVESSETGVDGLQPRESFPDAVGYVMHWVRAVLHDWKEALHRSVPEVVAHERFGTGQQLGEAERAVAPLLRLLEACSLSFSLNESVQVWSVGNNKWMNGKVVEVLASETLVPSNKSSFNSSSGNLMPAGSVLVSFNGSEARKWVSGHSAGTLLRKPSRISLSKQAIEKLESIASLSAQREYHAANQAYIELTLGHSRWHGDLSISGLTGSNKAPRNGFKVKRDQGNFLDTEEAKVYMFCLKRLVSFLQLIRPNADVSKHCT